MIALGKFLLSATLIAGATFAAPALSRNSSLANEVDPTPHPPVVDVNDDPAALADICERVAAGELFEWVIYDCSGFAAFQVDCSDPERATAACFPDATPPVEVPGAP